jgi:hypothetical protein
MSVFSEFYPDKLIAGDKKLVTTEVMILSGVILKRGTVLGRVKVVVPTTGAKTGTGDGTCTLVSGGGKTIPGNYVLTCVLLGVTHGGSFQVVNPLGKNIGMAVLPNGAGGTIAFSSDEINFTLTDGGTNFIVGDYFTIAVTDGCPATGSLGGIGNGTCTVVTKQGRAKIGTYTATCVEIITNSGKFEVKNPDGASLGFVYACSFSGTGGGTVTQVHRGNLKQVGRYAIKCTVTGTTHGGTLTVKDPSGNLLGTIVMTDVSGNSVRFVHDEISFLITDAGTKFAVNDEFKIDVFESEEINLKITDGATDFDLTSIFSIAVTIGGHDCKQIDSSATDGSSAPFAVLSEDIDATSANTVSIGYTEGQFNENGLYFGGADTIDTHRQVMRELGMIVETAQEAGRNP